MAATRVIPRILDGVVAIALSYQLLVVWYSVHGALAFYYAHLGLVLTLVAVSLAASDIHDGLTRRRAPRLIILGLALAAGLLSTGYLHLNVGEIELRQPFITEFDFAAGAALIVSVLLLTVRVWGWILTAVISVAILYFAFGDLIPGPLHFNPPDSEIIMSYLAGMGGARGVLWGVPLSANTLFLIIVFGGILKGTRILEMFNEVGKSLLNVTRGGICYSSILASTAIGMVTGQAVANVALSGSVTIPAMKQRGLSGPQAGAVEVVSSLGSQLIPPIMGLGGFLMAVNLGVPYVDVATAAVIPAFLFVATVIIAAFFLTQASATLQVTRETVDVRLIFWMLPSFLIPFLTLLVLLYMRYSPSYAAFWAIVLLTVMSCLRPARYRPSLPEFWSGTIYGVVSAANLGLILAGIGLVVQVLITTGAGFELGRLVMLAAGDYLAGALVLGMMLSLFTGLGLPTPAAYALIAIIMIPFLIDLGIEPLVAHFFGFYFAIFSAVTPPVAVGIMAATRISGASFYATVRESARISIVCLLIPYSFVAYPSLLDFPRISVAALVVTVSLLTATAMWGAAIYGILLRRLSAAERLIMLVGPLGYLFMLLTQVLWLALIPIALFALFVLVKAGERDEVVADPRSMSGRRNPGESCAARDRSL